MIPGLHPDFTDIKVQGNIAGIMAMDTIVDWRSPDCMTCWVAEWVDGGGAYAKPLLAVDRSNATWVTTFDNVNWLAEGQAKAMKEIVVNATRVSLINCGFEIGARPPNDDGDEDNREL